MMELPSLPPISLPTEPNYVSPTFEVNKRTGEILIKDLLIDVENNVYIVARFRGLRGSDDAFVNRCLSQRDDDGQADWLLLAHLCTQWGDLESVVSADFTTNVMPYDSIKWLRSRVLTGHYFRIP